jgi:secreted trypsin-like serine protease
MRCVQCLVLLCSVGNVVAIVGGVVKPPSSSIVKIVSQLRQCTGIVVGPLHVLTAAHCLTALIAPPPQLTQEMDIITALNPRLPGVVTLAPSTQRRGEYVQGSISMYYNCLGTVCGTNVQITRYFFHPCYIIQDGSDFRNDLALLEISSTTPFRTDAVMRVDGVRGYTPVEDMSDMAIVTMSGYGEEENLSGVRVNLLPVANCIGREFQLESGITQEASLCVGGATPSSDNIDMHWGYACLGDAGGPVEVQSGDGPWTIGIVTTTTKFPANNQSCTAPGRLVFATRLAPHGGWINATIENRDWTCAENNHSNLGLVANHSTAYIHATNYLVIAMGLIAVLIPSRSLL